MFVAVHSTFDVSLTTPMEHCCNCGKRKGIELVETPLRRTRFFFLAGTELTLKEHFPYCTGCAASAGRLRLGWGSKLLSFCLVTAAVFLVLVLAAASLPAVVGASLFTSSLVIAAVLTLAYFFVHEWGKAGSTYYQPVSLVSAKVDGDTLDRFRLRFYNPSYAARFLKVNTEMIESGVLEVEVHGAQPGVR
jgi:hypothetical protein